MTSAPTRSLAAAALAAALGLSGAALAQGAGQPAAPNMPAPGTTIPEKVDPPLGRDPGSTGTTLSDRLEKTDGVIRPPSGIAPDMTVPAPVPNPGTTPVIPPPGSPGGSQAIDPK